jgi:RNA-directed DNA polymerase
LANVYLHAFDQAQATQQEFVGRLTRYADDFVLQCGTAEQARRALQWARAQLAEWGLRLHPEKTRVVEDREGFDFLGFHHRRVALRKQGRPSWGVLRWPSRKACQRFRERVRWLVGPPGRLRQHWSECLVQLRRYLVGWCQYYRHGESGRVFRRLDRFAAERIARNTARSQPKQKHRRRRTWQHCLRQLQEWGKLPRLEQLGREAFRSYRGRGNVRWRAV